jgi:hypothetical protein
LFHDGENNDTSGEAALQIPALLKEREEEMETQVREKTEERGMETQVREKGSEWFSRVSLLYIRNK